MKYGYGYDEDMGDDTKLQHYVLNGDEGTIEVFDSVVSVVIDEDDDPSYQIKAKEVVDTWINMSNN